MEQKHLTPESILSYLCELEQKLPNQEYKIYLPSHRHDHDKVTIGELNDECQLMLDFVGMRGYKADVTYAKLDSGCAGNTKPGETPNRVVHINISETMEYNWPGALATLAHEICHHVVYTLGRIRPMEGVPCPESLRTELTETYTDLCTIYIGFGQLVLDGNKSVDNRGRCQHLLGYMDWNTYEVTAHIVGVVRGGADVKNTGLGDSDKTVNQALVTWMSDGERKRLANRDFVHMSSDISDDMQYISCLEKVLEKYKAHLSLKAEQSNSRYEEMVSPQQTKKLSAFRKVYEATQRELLQPKDEPRYGAIEYALYSIYTKLKNENKNGVEIPHASEWQCPCCGRRQQIDNKIKGKLVIKKCVCGKRILINTHDWTPDATEQKASKVRKEKQRAMKAEALKSMPWIIRKLFLRTAN